MTNLLNTHLKTPFSLVSTMSVEASLTYVRVEELLMAEASLREDLVDPPSPPTLAGTDSSPDKYQNVITTVELGYSISDLSNDKQN